MAGKAASDSKDHGKRARNGPPKKPDTNKGQARQEPKNKAPASTTKPGIESEAGDSKKSKHIVKSDEQKPSKADALKSEVFKLGGDEKDWQMIKDIDSDNEELTASQTKATDEDKKLQKELQQFMKGLPFDKIQASAGDDEEDDGIVSDDEGAESAAGQAPPVAQSDKQESKLSKKTMADAAADLKNLANADKSTLQSRQGKELVPFLSEWHTLALPELPQKTGLPTPSPAYITKLFEKGKELLGSLPPSQTDKFISQIISTGTLSDRTSALALLVSDSPMNNINALETLKTMSAKKKRDEAMRAIRVLVDWFSSKGLPANRKLCFFQDQPLIIHPQIQDQHLVVWAFEDYLKRYYFELLQLIEGVLHDPIEFVRSQGVALIATMLLSRPEQESNLLRLLVNKVGDSNRSIASKASYHLLQLISENPGMKSIVAREVTDLVYRSDPQSNAKYFSIITLNQIPLTRKDVQVAADLIKLYFKSFEEVLKQKTPAHPKSTKPKPKERSNREAKIKAKGGIRPENERSEQADDTAVEQESKVIAAILTGLNRALPFTEGTHVNLDEHINMLFKITYSSTFNVSVQALSLIAQVAKKQNHIMDRFYKALYASLLDPRLATSSKQAIYLNLVFNSIKADGDSARVAAFTKRIIQTLQLHQPSYICGCLYLLGQIFTAQPRLRTLVSEAEDDSLETMQEIGDTAHADHVAARPYDGRKRDPQFSHADKTCLWELLPLQHHFHPSIRLHAQQLLQLEKITSSPDLNLHTIIHFLDRFVYRNPKKAKSKGASSMQPTEYSMNAGQVTNIKGSRPADLNVNDESFWRQAPASVPVEQAFFHKFFLQRNAREKKSAAVKSAHDGDSDIMSDGEDAEEGGVSDDEDEVWQAMQQSMPAELNLTDDDDDDEEDLIEEDDIDSISGTERKAGSDSGDEDLEMDGMMEDDDDLLSALEEDADFEDDEAQSEEEEKPKKKRKQAAPTFASMEDYAHLLVD